MSAVTIQEAVSDAAIGRVRALFREYAASIGTDLSYQGFNAELEGLPGAYAAPTGVLLLATADGCAVGCGALRRFDERTGELKRLFVRPEAQGQGLGRQLAGSLLHRARQAGYSRVLLDTLPTMAGALRLYESLGFVRCPAYYECPVEGNVFLALELTLAAGKGSSAGPAIP